MVVCNPLGDELETSFLGHWTLLSIASPLIREVEAALDGYGQWQRVECVTYDSCFVGSQILCSNQFGELVDIHSWPSCRNFSRPLPNKDYRLIVDVLLQVAVSSGRRHMSFNNRLDITAEGAQRIVSTSTGQAGSARIQCSTDLMVSV